MGRLKRRLIAAAVVLILVAMSFLPSLFQSASPPPPPPRGSESSPATGSVRTAGGGPAPAGTTVRAIGRAREVEVPVRPDGTFHFETLPEGTHRFEAVCGPLRAAVSGSPLVRIELPGTLDIVGRVVAADSGNPVSGVLVRLGERETQTDRRGRFEVGDVAVPDGHPPAIRVSAPGYRERVLRPRPDSPWDDLFLRLERQ